MKKNMYNRILSMALALVMSLSLCIPAFAQFTNSQYSNQMRGEVLSIEEAEKRDSQIRALMSERLQLRLREMMNQDNSDANILYGLNSGTSSKRIHSIDEELKSFGVVFLQPDAVQSVLPMHKSMLAARNGNINTWTTWTQKVRFSNGKYYEVTTLCAEPNCKESALMESGVKIIHAAPGIAAGTCSFIRIALMASTGTAGTIASTVYDVFSTISKCVSKSTVVDNADATYNYQFATTMYYRSVKEASTNQEPQLSYVNNKADTLVQVTTDNISFGQGNFKLGLSTKTYEKSYTVDTGSQLQNAIDSFLNCYLVMHSFLAPIELKGVDGAKVFVYNPYCRIEPGFLD